MKPVYGVIAGVFVILIAGLGYFFRNDSSATPLAVETAGDMITTSNKILYYRNPMGLADTSPTPKKDSMGMDYLPVYERSADHASDTATVVIDSDRIQKLGVQTHLVSRRELAHTIRALGAVVVDESRLVAVSPQFDAWVVKLNVNSTGQRVNKGEVLFDAKIPKLYAAEVAYRQAIKKIVDSASAAAEIKNAAELALVKSVAALDDIGVGGEEMSRLQQGGEPFFQMPYRAPASGVVIAKNVVEGGYFSAGDTLYQLADFSKLWLEVLLPEQELNKVKVGDRLDVQMIADPAKKIDTQVEFIYPSIDPTNRSVRFRATLDNDNYQLKPGQSAEVWLQTQVHNAVSIPSNALLDSGREQWVLIALNDGVYRPRKVKVGERNLDWVEILEGLAEGERVVTSANFLLDSESRLQSALSGFSQSKKDKSSKESNSPALAPIDRTMDK